MKSLSYLLHNSFLKYKKYPAIKINEKIITYEELNNRALVFARLLIDKKGSNNVVGIITQRNYSTYIGVLASVYSGFTYVPINSKYPIDKINRIIKEANIQMLIADDIEWNDVKSNFEHNENIAYVLFPSYDTQHVVEKGPITFFNLNSIDALKQPIESRYDNNIYIMFTSGSTGNPKGVQVSNKNILSLLNNMNNYYELEPGFRSSQTFDLSFDLSISDIFFTWMKGGTICVLSNEELFCPSDYINREKINFWHSVPTLAVFMNKLGFLEENMYPSLQYSIFCGEPLTQTIANKWGLAAPNSTVENLYGPTEATVFITRYSYSNHNTDYMPKNGIVQIGKPFNDQRIMLVDSNEEPINNGEIGEIILSGDQVAKGYLDPEKTIKVFKKMKWDELGEIWYKTGDLAFVNDYGDIEFLERKDKQIKIGGRRVEIGEIESIIRKFNKFEDTIIVPYRDNNNIVQYLIGFVTRSLNTDDILEIREKCSSKLEDIFFPKNFIYIKEIPTIVSGKVDRRKLEELIPN